MRTIVHIVEATATGTLSMVCTSANLFANEGHSVHVIYSPRSETPEHLAQLFHSTIVLHEIKMDSRSAIFSIWQLRQLLKQLSPDIVHLHSSIAGFVGRIATAGTLFKSKLFYSPHCISMMRKDIRLKRYLFAALERIASLRKCQYVACSYSEKMAIQHWVGVDSIVLENAVNVKAPPNTKSIFDTSETQILRIATVGGIRMQKNPLLFAEISKICNQNGIAAHFTWIGDGDAAYIQSLNEAGVEVTGWVGKQEVEDKLGEADVYISTSEWEGMPVALIEAMAIGLFVIATRCAGNSDVIIDQATGRLFDTAEEAYEIIKSLKSNHTCKDRIVKQASLQAATRFSVDRYSLELHQIYFSK